MPRMYPLAICLKDRKSRIFHVQVSLTKTLVFQMTIEDDEERLHDALHESRRVYNETIRLAKEGEGRKTISSRMEEEADLVKNTTQRIVEKALNAMENYYEYEDYNLPSHTKSGIYPVRSNYREGYNLFPEEDYIRFRLSTRPYNPVHGVLEGSKNHLDQLRKAIRSDQWRVGTAEALLQNNNYELHIDITHTQATIRDKQATRTVVGVDVNEDCIALTALTSDKIVDSIVIDYSDIKKERHRYFTIRKRIQKAGATSFDRTIENAEERYVHDQLHKISRHVVEWCQQFERPCITFEDLKGMRDSIDCGTRMNRRLHSIPFRKVREFITYKAAFAGIPAIDVNPEYTSQSCALTNCGHTVRENRHKKRFKCRECSHQDHADRNASVNVAKRGLLEVDTDVPALKSLPQVKKVRRQASGCVDQPTAAHDTV